MLCRGTGRPLVNVVRRYSGVLICLCGLALFVQFGLIRVIGHHYNPGEMLPAARLALSAQRALLDGQFPLQFANDYAIALQPIFLYYTPVFYGLAAVAQIVSGCDPYDSLLVGVAFMVASTVAGVYRTIRALGGDEIASGIAAASLPFVPYFLTDVFTRTSYAELSAWAAYPWMAFFLVRFCQLPRWQPAVGLILSTALYIMCHKIFLGWGVIFLAVFAVAWLGWRPVLALAPALLLVLAAALGLSAPYWVNAFLIAKSLNIGDTISSAAYGSLTSSLSVLWPFPFTHPSLKEQYKNFSLQLGPPALFALIFGWGYVRENGAIRAALLVTAVALLFACSFFVMPQIWLYMPTPLTVIQFPYRLLLFAATFGAIGFGLYIAALMRVAPPLAYASCMLVLAMLLGFWWQVPLSPNIPGEIDGIAISGSEVYFEKADAVLPEPVAVPSRDAVQARGNTVTATLNIDSGGLTVLPVQYSRLLVAELNAAPATIFNANGLVAMQLVPGVAEIRIRRIEVVGFGTGLLVALFAAAGLIPLLRERAGRRVPLRLKFI